MSCLQLPTECWPGLSDGNDDDDRGGDHDDDDNNDDDDDDESIEGSLTGHSHVAAPPNCERFD